MTYLDMYMDEFGNDDPKGCPYHYEYERYAMPITTNGCIHKNITCDFCWSRCNIPFKVGDVVHAKDNQMEGNGIVIENSDTEDPFSGGVLVAFDHSEYATHGGNSESINAPGGYYEENIFRYFNVDNLELEPFVEIEDIMPREKFISLLKLGYE